jgi:hypothetical protein
MGQRFSAEPLKKRMPDEALIQFFLRSNPADLYAEIRERNRNEDPSFLITPRYF